MTPDLQNKLYTKYPLLFVNSNKSPFESCMGRGIECSDGWYKLIDMTCDIIQKHIDNENESFDRQERYIKNNPNKLIDPDCLWLQVSQVEFLQIKEKFGTLTIYYKGGDDEIQGYINFAWNMSAKICEKCGSFDDSVEVSNKLSHPNWIQSLCSNCKKL